MAWPQVIPGYDLRPARWLLSAIFGRFLGLILTVLARS
jgi:hypothetical protein